MIAQPTPRRNIAAFLATTAFVTMLAPAPSHSADLTWVGLTGNWATGSNWSSGSPPNGTTLAPDKLTFGSGTKTMNNNLSAGLNFNELVFSQPDFNLSGNGITMKAPSTMIPLILPSIEVTHTSGASTVNLPITLGNSCTFSAAAGGRLNLGSSSDPALGAHTLTLTTGTGGRIEMDGTTSGTGGVTITGTGLVALDASQNATGTYSVQGGTCTLLTSTIAGPITTANDTLLQAINANASSNVTVAGDLQVIFSFDVAGNLTFNSAGDNDDLEFDISGTLPGSSYGQIEVAGSTVTTSSHLLHISAAGGYPLGTEFILIDKTSSGAISSATKFRNPALTPLNEGTESNYGSLRLRFSYIGGTGNDFTATVVPAPVSGTTRDWDGGTDSANQMRTANNWNDDTLPQAGDILRFGSVSTIEKTVLNNGGGNYGGIQFAGSGGFTIEDDEPSAIGKLLLLSGSGISTSHTTTSCTIKSALLTAASQSWTVGSSGSLAIDAPATVDLAGFKLTLNPTSLGILSLNAPVSGEGNLIKEGSGLATLGGTTANTYVGTTAVNRGELRLTKSSGEAITGNVSIGGGANPASLTTTVAEKIANSAAVTIRTNGTFAPGAQESITRLVMAGGTLNGGSNLTILVPPPSGTADDDVEVTQNSQILSPLRMQSFRSWSVAADKTLTVSGELSVDALHFPVAPQSKGGAGTLRLNSPTMTSLGAPTQVNFAVNEGTLEVNTTSTSTCGVSITEGTLSGNGRVKEIQMGTSGGTVSPGVGLGTSTMACTRFGSGALGTLVMDLNTATAGTGYDQLSCSGDVILGNASLEIRDSQTFATGTVFRIIDKTITGSVNGTFLNLPENSTFPGLFNTFRINYTGGTGNDVTLTIIQPAVSVSAEAGSPAEGINRRFFVTLSIEAGLPVTVDYTSADGTAIAPGDYTPVSGQVTIPAGQTSAEILVPTIDDSISEPSQSVVIQISNPVNATLGTSSASGFIGDNDPLPVMSVSENISLLENAGPAVFTVSLDRLSERAPTFTALSSHGSATSADYSLIATALTFGPTESTKQVSVGITDDSFDESDENFSVTFASTHAGLQPFETVVRTVTILNDDPLATVQVLNPLGVTEGTAIPFSVQVSPVSGREVRVDYSTTNGSAQSPGDYTSATGTFIVPPFTQFATVQVPTIDDEVREGTETFVLQISNPLNATLGAQTSVNGIINDNDPLPVASVSTTGGLINESVTSRIFTVSLDRPSAFQASVGYATENVSATAPDDYTSVSGTLVFAPGQVSKTVEVTLIDDNMDENNESFRLRINAPVGATLGVDNAATNINDNDALPVLTVSSPDSSVPETNGPLEWTLTLDRPSQRLPRVDFLFTPGTATHPDDFTGPLSGNVTFAKGETSRTISLVVVNDDITENNETFAWSLTNSQTSTLAFTGRAGTITIVNDDIPDLVLAEGTIHPGDEVTPPSISGVLTGGQPNGMAVAEVSSDLGVADPWTPIGSVAFDANGEATVANVHASEDHIGVGSLFFRFRKAGVLLDHFNDDGSFHPTDNSMAASSLNFGPSFTSHTRAAVPFTVPPGDAVRFVSLKAPISEDSTMGANLRITLRSDAGGSPGALVDELTSNQALPGVTNPFSSSTIFKAPSFPELTAGATYWIVCEPIAAAGAGQNSDYRWFLNQTPERSVTFKQQSSTTNLPADPWPVGSFNINLAFRIETIPAP